MLVPVNSDKWNGISENVSLVNTERNDVASSYGFPGVKVMLHFSFAL